MTTRRTLGAGPQSMRVRAMQADLLGVLPDVRLPDLEDLRARGVLGTSRALPSAPRRTLGSGGRAAL